MSFSDTELPDCLSCQVPDLSELLLLATTGPGPDPRLSPTGREANVGCDGVTEPSVSFPDSLLAHLPFKLSQDDT